MRRYRYVIAITMAILAAIIIVAPVLAAYYTEITVTESDGNSYDMLPVAASIDIDYLATNNFIESDGRDVRVKTIGGAEVPFMLVDDKVLFASSIDNDRQNTFRLSTGNSLIDDFAIITGDGGYVTIAHHANLELADNFDLEYDGYIDTSSSTNYYPTVEGATTWYRGSQGTSHVADLPTDITKGDLLLLFFNTHATITNINTPSGWTSLFKVGEGTDHAIMVAYKEAAGGESTVTVTTTASVYSTTNSYRISGYTSAPEATYTNSETYDDKPDSPILTPTWDEASTLWITGFGMQDTRTVSSNPTSYGSLQYVNQNANACGSARRNLKATSEDPSYFTMSGSCQWYAWTVAVRGEFPTGNIIYKPNAIGVGGNNDDIIAAIHGTSGKVLKAESFNTGDYKINVYADTTNFKLDIDDSPEDSTALSGATVLDNANDWLLTFTYADYYKHTTSDTLRLTYEPDDIITGTTLPNELAAGTYDGTITYGSEPSGVSVSVSGLETYEISYPMDPAGSQDIISPTTAPLFDVDLDKLAHNPLQPIVALIAAEALLTERLVWLAGAFIGLFVALLIVLWKSEGQLTFTAFAGLGFCIIMYLSGIFPLWTIVVFAFGAVSALVWERVIAL